MYTIHFTDIKRCTVVDYTSIHHVLPSAADSIILALATVRVLPSVATIHEKFHVIGYPRFGLNRTRPRPRYSSSSMH